MNLKAMGLTLHYEFITPEEEADLIKNFGFTGEVKHAGKRNSILRWGSDKAYRSNMVSAIIPDYFTFLLNRVSTLMDYPDSVSVNEYLKGQSIAPHIDTPNSGDIISVLSLNSPAIMELQKNGERETVELPPRSLMQMKGQLRWEWEHSIMPVENTRYSVVFRCSNLIFNSSSDSNP